MASFAHIERHCHMTRDHVDPTRIVPTRIVPTRPIVDRTASHHRGRLAS
jgi:hypothetical protein